MKPTWIIIGLSAIGVVGVAAFASVIFLLGVYRWHWESPFAVSVARTFPIPAARFAGRSIPLRDYYRDVNAIKTYLISDEAKSQGISRSVTDEDRKQALERLLTESALNELARLRNITIDNAELDRLIDEEFNASGTTRGDLSAYIQKTYGWTYDDFKTHIAAPALLTRYLEASFSSDYANQDDPLGAYIEKRLKQADVVRYVRF